MWGNEAITPNTKINREMRDFEMTFYDARDLSEFLPHMQECLQQDYRERFYEDFYCVVVKNDKFEDWFPALMLLGQTFND